MKPTRAEFELSTGFTASSPFASFPTTSSTMARS
jgi:hypothetical protein